MRCFQCRVGDEDDLHFVPRFKAFYPITLFVEQVSGDFDRQLCDDLRGALLACLLANDAQDGQCQRFDAANRANTGTTRAGQVARLAERLAQPLT